MTVDALIQAAGAGTRLGLGPKAFVMLDGTTLLERAVALLDPIADQVVVAVAPADVARAVAMVGGPRVRVVAGGGSRSETTRRLIDHATAPWLLLHDVVHPFATADLVRRLLAAARAHGASAPGIVNTEFLYGRDGTLLHAPGDILVGQKPVAFSRAAALAGYAAADVDGSAEDPSLLDVLARGGVRTRFVEGDPGNIKITSPADLAIARAIIATGRR